MPAQFTTGILMLYINALSANPDRFAGNHSGIGGDNSDRAVGTFFEGAMTAGYSSQAADDAVQAEIVSAGYLHLTMESSR